MTTRRLRARRGGFTLLEVLLASAIAVLLLGGLYVSLELTLRQVQEGRAGVEADTLARSVVNRINIDLTSTLGPMPPKSGGAATGGTTPAEGTTDAASGTSGTTGTGTTGGTGTTTGTTGTGSGTGTTSADGTTGTPTDDASMTDESQALASDIPFQAGLVGSEKQLTVFTSRVPTTLTDFTLSAADAPAGPSDLRRVTYWLSGSGVGLCRQERPWVTADGVRNSAGPELTDEAADVIADEVVDVNFEYFDGSGWTTSWDGSVAGPDGAAPLGPPRAVRVTLTLELPAARGNTPIRRDVQHVVALRAAPGLYVPPGTGAETDTGMTTDMSGTTTSGGTTP